MSLIDEYFSLQSKYETQYGDKTIIFLEKGMFYEIYEINNDLETIGKATIVSQLLNIQLTRSNKKILENNRQNPLMTGFPVVSLKKNLKIILEAGYTVVAYDQKDDPSQREISQIYSPGTYIEEHKTHLSNYVCSIYIEKYEVDYSCGISFVELSTGESHIYEFLTDDSILLFENINRIIESFNSKEYIFILKGISSEKISKELNTNIKLVHFIPFLDDSIEYQNEILKKVYLIESQLTPIEYLDLEQYKYGCTSFIYLLQFCYEHNSSILEYIDIPNIHSDNEKLILHNNALYQLNIMSIKSKDKGITCLFDVVDNTSTPMGKRKLRKILLNPITDITTLEQQYNEIEKMKDSINWYENQLKSIIDIERYHRKLSLNKISPSELSNLQTSYESIQVILSQNHYDTNNLYLTFTKYYNEFISTFNFSILKQFAIDNIQENIFNKGKFEEIDKVQDDIKKYNDLLENECKKMSNLINNKDIVFKIEYTTKNGYVIYSTQNRCDQLQKIMKDKYFFKKESKTKVIVSSDKINSWIENLTKYQNIIKPLVTDKFKEVIQSLNLKYMTHLKEVCDTISNIDIIKSKSKTALENDHCKPTIEINEDNSSFINARNMRHAIIECLDTDCDYVPNDVLIDNNNCGILLYGVNGSGKSCYSKAIGLCVTLAQSGHYVPCDSFKYFPFTKLYTRITSDDNIFRGQSSFFVEMTELKSILNYSDNRSIVIGDEVCKGTEDISAVAIVGTAIKHLIDKNTKFIFATHLHKLPYISTLKDESKLKIKHITVDFEDCTIFSRKIKDGTGDVLYGLEIAHSILQNEEFHHKAFNLRNELLNKSSKLIADKKSKYNSKLYVDHCQICGIRDNLEAHHIVFQSQSKIRKDRKSNLVVLCEEHHNNVHNGNLTVEGWTSTTNGKMLKYSLKE